MAFNLADMYSAFDQIREMGAEPGARVVAGHDPLVAERFGSRAGSADVILLSLAALRRATVRVLVTVKRVKVAGLAKDD
jgi:hypothetical protein